MLPSGVAAAQVALGSAHSCARLTTGDVYCWGWNFLGQLGDGTDVTRRIPVAVVFPGGVRAIAIAAGASHTCAISDARRMICWGGGEFGQLGDGATAVRYEPVAVALPQGETVAALTAGSAHTCALTDSGIPMCWGHNGVGQIGDGTTALRTEPVAVEVPAGQTVTKLTAGNAHTCGATAAGGALCWGSNRVGQLGDGTFIDRHSPVAVALPPGVTIASIAAGHEHTCALTTTGRVLCWGSAFSNELGDGSIAARSTPAEARLPAASAFVALAAGGVYGDSHNCAVTASGAAVCWGSNSDGQLGDPTWQTRPPAYYGVPIPGDASCGDGIAVLGERCDAGAANGVADSCCDVMCQISPAGDVCRPSADACDAAEICSGTDPRCPEDVGQPDGTACDDGTACSGADQCRNDVCAEGIQCPGVVFPAGDVIASPVIRFVVTLQDTAGSGKAAVVVTGQLLAGGELTKRIHRPLTKKNRFRTRVALRLNKKGRKALKQADGNGIPLRIVVEITDRHGRVTRVERITRWTR